MKTIIAKLSVIAFFTAITVIGLFAAQSRPAGIVQAVGDLVIDWGVPSGSPIFVIGNMLPGDEYERTVTITNNASVARQVALRADERSNPGIFPAVLNLTLVEGSNVLYGGSGDPKTLQDLFNDTATPSTLPLFTLNSNQTKNLKIKIVFQESAENEYQNLQVIFDLIIGLNLDMPSECRDISFTKPPIYGTSGNDRIYGTTGNDLIYALEGDDYVAASLGDDCIIGGSGNDQLRGETGKDVIFGQEGDDQINGGDGVDLVYGGSGNDIIRSENGNDKVYADSGNDTVYGGNNNDLIYVGDGNDTVYGENGQDQIWGESGTDYLDGGGDPDWISGGAGNDTLHGQAGSDTLIGDADTDSANGWSGTDTCDAETELNCEL